MKKNPIFLLFFCFSLFAGAQELSFPSEPADDCGFSLGSKGTIRLIPADSGRYKCSYVKIEPYSEIVKYTDKSTVFSEKPEPGTIDFFFGIASMDPDKKEKEEQYAVVLMLNSGCKDILSYKAGIMLKGEDNFVPTSVMSIFPGITTTEIWPYYIEMIHLQQFEKSGTFPIREKKGKK